MSLSEQNREEFPAECHPCLYVLYIFTSSSSGSREKVDHLGRLLLPRSPLAYSLCLNIVLSSHGSECLHWPVFA